MLTAILALLRPLLTALLPLLRRSWFWVGLVIGVLILLLLAACSRIRSLGVALAAKPKIETHTETKVQTKTVQGPERIVERIVERPGAERIVERTIYRDPVTTTTGAETIRERNQEPAGPLQEPRRWVAGVGLAPMQYKGAFRNGTSLRVGRSFGGIMDLSYVLRLDGPASSRHQAEVALRF